LVMDYGGADQPEGDPPPNMTVPPNADGDETSPKDGDGDVKMEGKDDKKEDDEPYLPLEPETQASLDLKLCLLNMYNEKIDKRLETKAVVFDRGLLEFKKLQAIERKRPKEEREFVNKHKPFARLQTSSDYDVFIDGLLYEVALRKRIQELQEYRRMGITSFAEAERYEKDKLTLRALPPRDYRHSTEPDDLTGVAGRYKAAGPLTLATSTNFHLLTPQEQLLCSQLRILPKPYLAIKQGILREYAKRGGKLRKRDAKDLFKVDGHKTAKIYELMEKSGVFRPFQQSAAPPSVNGTLTAPPMALTASQNSVASGPASQAALSLAQPAPSPGLGDITMRPTSQS